VQGKVLIKEKQDSRHTKGHLAWAPIYQMYKFTSMKLAKAAQEPATAASLTAVAEGAAEVAAEGAAAVNTGTQPAAAAVTGAKLTSDLTSLPSADTAELPASDTDKP